MEDETVAAAPPQMPQVRNRAVDLGPEISDPAPENLSTHEGMVMVSRVSYGVETNPPAERIAVPKFETEPARIRVSGGVTRNMGDYNSARIDVMVELPCLPESSEIERAYQICSATVDQYIRRELGQAGIQS